jgi:hypothetical protein
VTIDEALALPGEPPLAIRAWSTATLRVRLLEVAAAGALAAVLIILVWLRLRPDLAVAATTPFFWLRGLYTAALAALMLGAASALDRPGSSPRPSLTAAGAVVAAMLLAAGFEAPRLPPSLVAHVLDPRGLLTCIGNIVGLAAPMLLIAGVGLRRVDLERPGLMGLFVGLFCGAVAATVYGLHCQDSTFAFIGLWYTAGIAVSGAIGAGALKLLWLLSGIPAPE